MSSSSKRVGWKSKVASYRRISPRNCDNEIPEMKKDLLQYANKLLTRTCCDKDSCDLLSEQLQNTQYSCNDTFGKMHSLENKDSKGNLPETICETLKDRKIEISRKADGYRTRRQSMGGKRSRRKRSCRKRSHNKYSRNKHRRK